MLLAQSRGFSLADIGLLFTVHGLLIVLLELPTGGIADVLGRRAVVLAGAALHLLSCLVFALAQTLPLFCLAIALLAVGRALDSGPLEAWYVDTVHALDAGADVAPGLAKHSAADGAGLAVGAVVGGLLPSILGVNGATGLALLRRRTARPAVRGSRPAAHARDAAAARGEHLRRAPHGCAGRACDRGDALRLSATDRPLRLVLLLTPVGGVGLVAFELLASGRFAELAGSPEQGAAVLGSVLGASFRAAAVGALLAPSLRRVLHGSTRAACVVLGLLGATALAAFAVADVVLLPAVALPAYYVAHGASWPLLAAVLQTRVMAEQRATAVSAMSLSMALGGIAGNLVLPRLPDAEGHATAYAAVAGLVLLGAAACRRLRRGTRVLLAAGARGVDAGSA